MGLLLWIVGLVMFEIPSQVLLIFALHLRLASPRNEIVRCGKSVVPPLTKQFTSQERDWQWQQCNEHSYDAHSRVQPCLRSFCPNIAIMTLFSKRTLKKLAES
jgi:hypothetical protein